jgi:hypothetical protein
MLTALGCTWRRAAKRSMASSVPGLAVALLALRARRVVLEAPAQAFGGQQALEEVEVAFAVLGADRARRQFLRHVEGEAHLRVVFQQLGDDVLRVLVLVDVAVAAQAQQRERRFELF